MARFIKGPDCPEGTKADWANWMEKRNVSRQDLFDDRTSRVEGMREHLLSDKIQAHVASGAGPSSGEPLADWSTEDIALKYLDPTGSPQGSPRSSPQGSDPEDGDSDGDTLSDAEEATYQTDPSNSDSDGDGLSDSSEIELGTDPNKADSDEDGFSDFDEKEYESDPLDASSYPKGQYIGGCSSTQQAPSLWLSLLGLLGLIFNRRRK